MIDPSDVTQFNRSKSELEEFLLFCTIVAGKKAKTQSKKLDLFLNLIPDQKDKSPFEIISFMIKTDKLMDCLKTVGMGQYSRLNRVFTDVIGIDLKSCSTDDLESIKGIGPKTSRYFILHSRKDQSLAVLDRHILKWMSEKFNIKTPPNTPSSKKTYRKLETIYVDYCADRGISTANLDLAIWNLYSNKESTPGIPV